jgi:hypothetical protein
MSWSIFEHLHFVDKEFIELSLRIDALEKRLEEIEKK